MLEKIFGDYVELGLSLIASALILSAIAISMSLSGQYHDKQLEGQIMSEQIKEHRNNLFYTNTKVYQQDIVALTIRHKGDREVHVKLKNGTIYSWSKSSKSSEYKISDVNALLPIDSLYKSELIYGPNKYDVIGYQFLEE